MPGRSSHRRGHCDDGSKHGSCRNDSPRRDSGPDLRPHTHARSGNDPSRHAYRPVRRSGLRRSPGPYGSGPHARPARRRNSGRNRRRLRESGFRTCRRGAGRIRRRTVIPAHCGGGFRRRTLVQFRYPSDRNRPSRRLGPRGCRCIRHSRTPQAPRHDPDRDRHPAAENTPHTADSAAAVHPIRLTVSSATTTKPRRLSPRRRYFTLHPLRSLRSDLPDAGYRPGRRNPHRRRALHPLLRLRQGVPRRSPQFHDTLRGRTRPQFRKTQTARNPVLR